MKGLLWSVACLEKLAEASGGYIIAADMIEKLSKSKRGYMVKERHSLKSAVNEVIPIFQKQHREEILGFLKTPKFQRDLAENDEMIQLLLREGEREGVDEKAVCD